MPSLPARAASESKAALYTETVLICFRLDIANGLRGMVSKTQIQFTQLGKVVPVKEIFCGLWAGFAGFGFSSIKQCWRCVF